VQNSSPPASANRQIARAAATIMAAFVVSKLVGLLASALTAQAFGTSAESEAFFAANRFSEILFNLVAGGALASAFIPTLTGLLARGERAKAWSLVSAVAWWVSLALTVLSLLAILFSRQVVHYILAPGFAAADPAKEALTAALLRVQVLSAVIFGLSGLVMGVLNAHQKFLLASLAPAMYHIGWISGIYLLAPRYGVHGVSWGVVAGALLHLLIQLPDLLRLPGRRLEFTLGLHLSETRQVALLMAPRLLGVAVVQLNFLLNTYLASLQPEGSVTFIALAFPLMIMPQSAIAQSIAIAALPTFSAQAALSKLDEMRASLAATLRGVLFLSLPASVGLVLLREPLVALLYQRGAFTAESTRNVAWALLWYAAGLVGHCALEIVARAFYALQDTRTPVIVGVGAMTLNLILSIAFSALFTSIGWMPHGGLALANSMATALETILLLALISRRLNGLEGRRTLLSSLKYVAASAAMAGGLVWWLAFSANMRTWQVTLGGLTLGLAMYALGVLILRAEEVQSVWRMLRRRIARS